jgi:hypothetical protein
VTLADRRVDIVPIARLHRWKRCNRFGHLRKQATDLRAVIDILAGQPGGDDLSGVGVDANMELSPGPARPCGVLFATPAMSRSVG